MSTAGAPSAHTASTTSAASGSFDVAENARRIGAYAWIEQALFEVLGTWVATVPEPEVTLLLGTHCHHHAWHAQMWRDRLPDLAELDPDRLTAPANPAVARFVTALAEPAPLRSTVEQLVGVYRVLLPRLVAAYSVHADATSPVTDAPTARILRLVLADDHDQWRDGELLLQSLIASPDDARRAADRHAELESIMVEAGGVTG